MIINFLSQLGLWGWFVLGLVLLILEILAPGIFFIWFGLAALVTGVFAFLLGSVVGFGWQLQIVLFLVLAVIFVLAGRRVLAPATVRMSLCSIVAAISSSASAPPLRNLSSTVAVASVSMIQHGASKAQTYPQVLRCISCRLTRSRLRWKWQSKAVRQ